MTKFELLKQPEDGTNEMISDIESIALSYTNSQLSTSAAENKWSAQEVAEHMLITSRIYLRNIEFWIKNFKGSISDNYKPGFVGKLAANSMLPNKRDNLSFKMRTFQVLDPARGSEPIGEKDSFGSLIETHKKFLEIYLNPDVLDLVNMKVESALGKMIMFRLGDAPLFNFNHNIRHMRQMKIALKFCLENNVA